MAARRAVICGLGGLVLAAAVPVLADTVVGGGRGGGVLWHPAPDPREVPLRAEVRAWPGEAVRVGEAVRFPVRVNQRGYGHLFVANPDGGFVAVAVNRPLAAGRWQDLGRGAGVSLVARPPLGRSEVIVVVTVHRLAAGVVSVGSAAGLQSFLAGRPAWSWTLARTRVDVRA